MRGIESKIMKPDINDRQYEIVVNQSRKTIAMTTPNGDEIVFHYDDLELKTSRTKFVLVGRKLLIHNAHEDLTKLFGRLID